MNPEETIHNTSIVVTVTIEVSIFVVQRKIAGPTAFQIICLLICKREFDTAWVLSVLVDVYNRIEGIFWTQAGDPRNCLYSTVCIIS
jgi:hypothetical protein